MPCSASARSEPRGRIPRPRIEMLQTMKLQRSLPSRCSRLWHLCAPPMSQPPTIPRGFLRACSLPPIRRWRRSPRTRPGSAMHGSSTRRSATRAESDFQDPDLGRRQSGRAAAHDVLHVQRPGLPLCGRVLFQGDDLCTERLEPPGPVPDVLKLPRGGVGPALYYVEHSLGSILRLSFFITKQMKVDLRSGRSAVPCRSFTSSWRAFFSPLVLLLLLPPLLFCSLPSFFPSFYLIRPPFSLSLFFSLFLF